MMDFDQTTPRVLKTPDRSRRTRPLDERDSPAQPAQQHGDALVFETVELASEVQRQSPKAATAVNNLMAFLVALFLVLIPIPYGANTALAWMAATVALAVMTTGYLLAILYLDPSRPLQFVRGRWLLWSVGLILLGVALQLLPIGNGPGAGWHDMPDALYPVTASFSPTATGLGLIRLASYAVLFVLVLEISTNRYRVERLLFWIYCGIVAHAIWGLMSLTFFGDTLLLGPKTAYEGVATGTFINRNSFATYLAFGLVIGTARLWVQMRGPRARSPRLRSSYQGLTLDSLVHLVWLLVVLAALFATGSRLGLMVGLLGVVSVTVLVLLKTGMTAARVTLVCGIGGLGLALGAVLLMGRDVTAERLVYSFVDSRHRLQLFSQTWDMILARPWLGYGLDSFPLAFEMFHQPALRMDRTWAQPHNSYLTLWAELGLPLGTVVIGMQAAVLMVLIRAIRRRELAYLPAVVAVAVMVVAAVHSLGDFSLEIAANTYLYVTLIALGLARRSYSRGTS